MRLPVFNIILMFIYLSPSSRSTYTTSTKWVIYTTKVPIDGTDLSGATVMMHAISTKPYFDTSFAQNHFDAGSVINHRY